MHQPDGIETLPAETVTWLEGDKKCKKQNVLLAVLIQTQTHSDWHSFAVITQTTLPASLLLENE